MSAPETLRIETAVVPVGYFVWTEKFGGYAFKNKLHETEDAAKTALASVVWHNRPNFLVRPVFIGAASST